jgi:hypothetical protein
MRYRCPLCRRFPEAAGMNAPCRPNASAPVAQRRYVRPQRRIAPAHNLAMVWLECGTRSSWRLRPRRPSGLCRRTIGRKCGEDDWLDYRLEHHPEFLRRVAAARENLRSGRGVRLEDLPS